MVISARGRSRAWSLINNNKLGGKIKVGLCLSGGGIKGAAHIGVIKALEEENIKMPLIIPNDIEIEKAVQASCSYPGVFCPT